MEESKKNIWVGFDIGKKKFNAAIDVPDEQNEKVAINNLCSKEFHRTPRGFERFLSWKRQQLEKFNLADREISIVMETTGCYSRDFADIIAKQKPDLKVVIESASTISMFQKSLCIRNKTDDLDAKVIARYGTERAPEPALPTPQCYLELREMKRVRDSLITARVALENAQETLVYQDSRKANFRSVQAITRQIETLEKNICKLVNKHPELQESVRILSSFPGVAFTAATAVLAESGPLERFKTSRAFSAMTGLAPSKKQSGTSLNRTKINRQGSVELRKSLYLISIVAVKRVPSLAETYKNHINRGKKPMQARVACMRKIATILRALIVSGRDFDENFEKTKVTTSV